MSNDETAVPRLVAIDRRQLILRTVDVEKLVEQEHWAGGRALIPKDALAWPILAVCLKQGCGLPQANEVVASNPCAE